MYLTKLPRSTPAPLPVSLEQVKQHLRILTNDEDDYLTLLINVAAEVCESESNRQLFTAQYQLTISSEFYPFRALNRRGVHLVPGPVQSVDTITANGVPVDVATWPVTDHHPYTLRPSWSNLVAGDVVITFTSGYGDSAIDIPFGLIQYMLLLIGALYANRETTLDAKYVVANPSYQSVLNTQRDVRFV